MEVGTGWGGGGGEQQDSEIHRWIFDSQWPALSVILLCVLRNQREKLTRQQRSRQRYLLQADYTGSLTFVDEEEETAQTDKDFPVSNITMQTYSCFVSIGIQLLF